MKLSVRTPGGHSAYPHVSKSANRIAAALIRDLESLESIVPATPEKVARALRGPEVRAGVEAGLGEGQPAEATVRGGVRVIIRPRVEFGRVTSAALDEDSASYITSVQVNIA